MKFELRVSNDERVIPVVRSFLLDVFARSSLEKNLHERLAELVVLCTDDAVKHAYNEGEDGSITIGIRELHGKLDITVRDYGMPQDIEEMETAVHKGVEAGLRLFGISCKELADEVHWSGYGPEGKELRISKWLHNTDITKSLNREEPRTSAGEALPAPEEEYTVRRMREGEGLRVSQLIYKAYGGTYFNRDVYYPERIESLDRKGAILSFVAVSSDGNVVGHYVLERNVAGPVAEGGEAVVDPAHRGRKLLERMKETALEEAHRIGLAGVYADAVTVHPYTQKSNVHFGARLACADLGIAPRNEHFLGLSGDQSQRISCLLYFLPLGKIRRRRAHISQRHKQIVEEIYASLGFPVDFGKEKVPEGKGEYTVKVYAGAARAMIRVEGVGVGHGSCHSPGEAGTDRALPC